MFNRFKKPPPSNTIDSNYTIHENSLEKNKVIVEGVNMVKKQGTGPATGFQAEQGLAWPHCPILKNVRDSIFCLYNGSKEACLEKSV